MFTLTLKTTGWTDRQTDRQRWTYGQTQACCQTVHRENLTDFINIFSWPINKQQKFTELFKSVKTTNKTTDVALFLNTAYYFVERCKHQPLVIHTQNLFVFARFPPLHEWQQRDVVCKNCGNTLACRGMTNWGKCTNGITRLHQVGITVELEAIRISKTTRPARAQGEEEEKKVGCREFIEPLSRRNAARNEDSRTVVYHSKGPL